MEGVASVANHLELPDRSAELYSTRKVYTKARNEIVSIPVRSELYGLASSPGEVYA